MGCGQSQSEYGEFKNELKPDSSDGSRDPSPTPTKPDSDGLDEEEEEDEEDREEDEESEPRDDERSTDSEEPEDEPRKDSKSEEEAGPVAVQRESLSSAEAIQRAAVSGRIAVEYPITAKVVRIFTSSTFTDTKVERNALMEGVYPKLRTFCQELGYEFQVVDMRWGVRDEATDDHLTSELCMREIKQCQTLSTGPNFITFLSQKYGYRPFPPKIKSNEFELIFEKIECEADRKLLSEWFKEDENSVPKQYLLQPIRMKLKHYADDSDQEKKNQDRDTWWAVFEKMQILLRNAASKAFMDEAAVHKFYWAVTEEEIYYGILQAKKIDNCCHWFRRHIQDLSDNTKDKMARRFMDISGDVDVEALHLLTKLKEELVPKKLPEQYITDYKVDWTDKGINYEHPGHKQYIDGFCVDFEQTLRRMIHKGISNRGHRDVTDPLVLECIQHLQFGQKKSDQFQGRMDFLSMLKNKAINDTRSPILLCGQPGSGKTSIMARLVSEVQEWKGYCDVIVRFLGTTSQSSNTRDMLSSLCKQIARLSDKDEDVPKDMKGLSKRFKSLIENIKKPIVILLDSLDQLHDYGGQVNDWVPKSLEKNVTFIMSVIPSEQSEVVPKLENLLKEENIIYVPDMPASEISLVLRYWLQGAGRCLTPDQQIVVEKACCALPLPLYMKLIYDEAATWHSYDIIKDNKLGVTLQEAIENVLEKVEKYHGSVLVRRALAYITASKNGLGSNEIEDVLSLDDLVLNSVYQYHLPPTRRLPPLLWVRIQFDLRDFLVTSGADGIQVTHWYHQQFSRVANERYLSDTSFKKEIHQLLGEYFSGEWADGRAKPFVDKKGVAGEQTRFVAPQPLVIKEEGDKTIYNLRKLREFPYHLTLAGMFDRLKKDTLLNFEWIYNKIQATDLEEVLDDCQFAIDACYDKEVELVHLCLHLSRSALLLDVNTLPSQLTGRLYSEDIDDMEYVKQLLHSAVRPDFNCMISTQGGLASSGSALVNTFAGHEDDITCIAVNGKGTKLLTYSNDDGMLKMWDMKKGNEIESYEPYKCGRVCSMQFYHGDKRVVLASEDRLSIYDLVTSQTIVTINVEEDEDRLNLCHAWDEGDFVAISREVEIIVYGLSSLKEKSRIPLKRDTEGNTEVEKEDIFTGWENYLIRYFKSCPAATIATIGPSTSLKKYPILSKKEIEHVAVAMATSSAGMLAVYCFGQVYTNTAKKREPYDPFMDIIDIKTLSKLHTFKGFVDNPFAAEKYLVAIGPRSFLFEREVTPDKFMTVVDLDTKSLSPAVQLHGTRYRQLIGSQDIYMTVSYSDPHVVQAINVRKAIIARAKKSRDSEKLFPDPGNLVGMMFGSQRYALYHTKSHVEMCVWDVVTRKTTAMLDTRLLTDGKIKVGHFSHTSVAVVSETEIIAVCPGNTDKLIGVDLVTNKLTFNLTGVAYPCSDRIQKCANIGNNRVAFIGPKSFQVSIFNHKTKTMESTISHSEEVKMSELVACKTGQIALTTDIIDMSSIGTLKDRHVYVFDLENQTCLKTIVYESEYEMANPMLTTSYIPSAALTSDGTYYLVSNEDYEFTCKKDPVDVGGACEEEVKANWRVYNLRTGEQRGVPSLTDHLGYQLSTNTVMYSQATHAFLGAYSRGMVALWDEVTLKCTSKFKAFNFDDTIVCMTLSSDGSILACSPSSSDAVILCDLFLGQRIMQFRSDTNIIGMLFSAEDKFLLLVGDNLKFIYQLYLHRSEDMRQLPPDTILHDHHLKSIQGQDLYGNK